MLGHNTQWITTPWRTYVLGMLEGICWVQYVDIYMYIYIYLFTQRVYLDVLRQCSLFDIHTREAEAKILGFISSTLNFL